MTVHPDQVYSEPGGTPLRFDLFRPETGGQIPLVICIHGGGWISGSKEDVREMALMLASKGYAAACPNYRLAPLHPYPAAVDDIHNFVCFVKEHASEWNVNPEEIAAWGHSAGGHLACMAGLTGDQRVSLVICSSGITDLTKPKEQHFPISWSFLEEFLAVPYEGNEELYLKASPIAHITPDAPPFLVVHGEADDIVPLSQTETLCQKLEENGVTFRKRLFPNELHSYSIDAWLKIEELVLDALAEQTSHAVR